MPTRRRPLTTRMRDAWHLTAAAVDAGAIESARAYARQAMQLSGWDRYLPGVCHWDNMVLHCRLVPRGWAYHEQIGDKQVLVIHPDAAPLLADWAHLATSMRIARELGSGLVRLDQVLNGTLLHALTPPEDASELAA